jgi:hypothetical protein
MTEVGGKGAFLSWASRLRFPWLLALTTALFVIDLAIPDLIPFVDEILLGLAALLLGSFRKPRAES